MTEKQNLTKFDILLGLSLVQKEKRSDDCPDEETVAAYFDNKLSPSEDKNFLSALNHCPDSYATWLSMLESIEISHPEKKYHTNSIGFFEHINNWFFSHQTTLTGALATGFLFLFIFNFSHTPFAQLPIDKQIVKIWQNSELLDLAYVDISQFESKGFTKSSINIMPYPEKVAFSSGFKQGLMNMSVVSQHIKSDDKTLAFLNALPDKPLNCQNDLCKKETHLNLQLGIWSSFVLQECQQNKKNKTYYWNKQDIVIKHFLKAYNDLSYHLKQTKTHSRYSNSLIKNVNKIEYSLNNLVASNASDMLSKQLTVCNNVKQLALSSIQSL